MPPASLVVSIACLCFALAGVAADQPKAPQLRGLQSLAERWAINELVLTKSGDEFTISVNHGMGDDTRYPVWRIYVSETAQDGSDACPVSSGGDDARINIEDGILPASSDGFEFTSLISTMGEGTSSLSFELDMATLASSNRFVYDEATNTARVAFCVLFGLPGDGMLMNTRELAVNIDMALTAGFTVSGPSLAGQSRGQGRAGEISGKDINELGINEEDLTEATGQEGGYADADIWDNSIDDDLPLFSSGGGAAGTVIALTGAGALVAALFLL